MVEGRERLACLGWNRFFEDAFNEFDEPDFQPARVGIEHNHLYRVYTASSELLASVTGKLRHAADTPSALPAVGDWVAIRSSTEGRAQILALLPRRTYFSRKSAGNTTKEQIVATNIDTVFLVSGLDGDFNTKRIERYLVATSHSGIAPIIVLNKSDLCEDVQAAIGAIREMGSTVPVHVTNCKDGQGIDSLATYLTHGHTVALLGSSGVGKSTLINRLLGYDRQRTSTVRRHDGRGRHTTVHRELLLHPSGGVIIDTPGMRELRLWDTTRALERTFDDIEALGSACRFRDCQHRDEPGCSVRQAVEDGQISADRLAHYHQLRDERTHLGRRRSELTQLDEKQHGKKVSRPHRRGPSR